MGMMTTATPARRRLPIMQGLLPFDRKTLGKQMLAGITLAALAIPEVMGYTSIAGMPVITGLYTILLPVVVFAVLGSSRHLVVGADSASAAIMAAGLAGMATIASPQYVALASLIALVTAGFLLLARVLRLGFLADFLSRTVLIGFLTGVGIQVACGQVSGMFGIPEGAGITINDHTFDNTIAKLFSTLGNLDETSMTTLAVSVSVIVVILGFKYVTKVIPGALVAVVGSIILSWAFDLESHGVAILGTVPSGLPSFSLPDVAWSDIPSVLGVSASIFIVVLAQSAATSRAYAAKYDDAFSEDVDLIGLSGANVAAGLTGTFVVNGSPTKTQMIDGAGGTSQVAQLTTGAVVVIVLLFLTVPLQYLPSAVLASVVFIIGIELVDMVGMRRVLAARMDEFVVATVTALAVVFLGVEQAIILAIVLSIIDHLRRSYRPPTAVLVESGGHLRTTAVDVDVRSLPGLVVYRFAGSLYYANANHFLEDVATFVKGAADTELVWFCMEGAAMPDVDYTGGEALRQANGQLTEVGAKLVMSDLLPGTRASLVQYGIIDLIGEDAVFDTMADLIQAFEQLEPTPPVA
jgi:high affinity sulfate transporter 1